MTPQSTPFYLVGAFTKKLYASNPAAVCRDGESTMVPGLPVDIPDLLRHYVCKFVAAVDPLFIESSLMTTELKGLPK